MEPNELSLSQSLYEQVKGILMETRRQAYHAVNFAMVQAYWQIGRVIVEQEQHGNLRAEYGKAILQSLSERLSQEFGKGFDVRNLQQMKKFYACYPNPNALRSQLTWTHYRLLLRVEDEQARQWYMEESVRAGWSSRQLYSITAS